MRENPEALITLTLSKKLFDGSKFLSIYRRDHSSLIAKIIIFFYFLNVGYDASCYAKDLDMALSFERAPGIFQEMCNCKALEHLLGEKMKFLSSFY